MSSKFFALIGLILGFVVIGGSSDAQTSLRGTVHKSTTTITTSESDDDTELPPGASPTPGTNDYLVTAQFGSKAKTGMAGCKTEEASQQVIKDLKADCGAWMKDRRTELKSKYQTGSCQEDCADCGMSLQRCTVSGVVHYSK